MICSNHRIRGSFFTSRFFKLKVEMQATRRKYLLFILAIALLQATAFSQPSSFPLDEWVKKLANEDSIPYYGVYEIADSLRDVDSATVIRLFTELEKKGAGAGRYFDLRFQLLKAQWVGLRRSCRGAE